MEFPTTRWSLLAEASLHGDEAAGAALEKFYVLYRRPVQAAVAARGMGRDESQDITQAFFLQLMEQGSLHRAQREKGRFRNFLFGALRHFMADQFDRATAAKRGGGITPLPLDGSEAGETPAAAVDTHEFDRGWALAILQRALDAVEAERPPHIFSVVKAFLPGSPETPSGAAAAEAAGMSESALRSEVSRVRQRLRTFIREEVSRTVSAPHEVDEEMTYLFEVLSRT